MVTTTPTLALVEAIEDNMATMSFPLQEKYVDTEKIKMELEKSRKNITALVIKTISSDNFLICDLVVEDDLHSWQTFFISLSKFKHMWMKGRIVKRTMKVSKSWYKTSQYFMKHI